MREGIKIPLQLLTIKLNSFGSIVKLYAQEVLI